MLIGSEEPKVLADYYRQLFGEPAWDDGGYVGWMIGSGSVMVGPHDEVKGKNVHPGRLLWNIESADVRADFERLKAAGATVIRDPYDPAEGSERSDDGPDMLIATFADPDDNYFQLVSQM